MPRVAQRHASLRATTIQFLTAICFVCADSLDSVFAPSGGPKPTTNLGKRKREYCCIVSLCNDIDDLTLSIFVATFSGMKFTVHGAIKDDACYIPRSELVESIKLSVTK